MVELLSAAVKAVKLNTSTLKSPSGNFITGFPSCFPLLFVQIKCRPWNFAVSNLNCSSSFWFFSCYHVFLPCFGNSILTASWSSGMGHWNPQKLVLASSSLASNISASLSFAIALVIRLLPVSLILSSADFYIQGLLVRLLWDIWHLWNIVLAEPGEESALARMLVNSVFS